MNETTGTSVSVSRGKSPGRNNEKKYIITEEQLESFLSHEDSDIDLNFEEHKEDKPYFAPRDMSGMLNKPQQSMSKAVKERFSELEKKIDFLMDREIKDKELTYADVWRDMLNV